MQCTSSKAKSAVDAIFADLHDATEDSLTHIILAEADEGLFTVRVGEKSELNPQPPNGALASIVSAVSRLALDADPERIHLHCAALSLNNKGVIISAPSGTGKTVLAANLAQRGWAYMSDEAVAFRKGTTEGAGFAKPLVVKTGGSTYIDGLSHLRISLDADADDGEDVWSIVPASRLGTAKTIVSIEPKLIVLLHWDHSGSADSPPAALHLHPADTVVALFQQTMDPERFGPDALTVLANLAASCHCMSVSVGPPAAVAAILEREIDADPTKLHVQEFTAPSNTYFPDWTVPAEVRSVGIGDRVVVHDTAGGAVVALDESGAAVWRALHGDPPTWWHPDTADAPETSSFLEALSAHALVSRRSPANR